MEINNPIANNYILNQVGQQVHIDCLPLPTWDMNTVQSKGISYVITNKILLSMSAIIRDDSTPPNWTNYIYAEGANYGGHIYYMDFVPSIVLTHVVGSTWEGGILAYQSTAFSRGYLIVHWAPL